MLSRWLSTRGKNGQKRMLILVLALAMSLSSSACRADNSITSNAPLEIPTELSTEQANRMKINIKVGNEVVTATLIDSKTTRDFVSLLPLTLTLEDYAKTEKISNLPKRLSTEEAIRLLEILLITLPGGIWRYIIEILDTQTDSLSLEKLTVTSRH